MAKSTLEKAAQSLHSPSKRASKASQSRSSVDLAFQARKLAPLALRRLESILKAGSDRDAIQAARTVLNRGYGREPIQVDVAHGLKGDQLFAVAEAIISRRKAAQLEAPPVEAQLEPPKPKPRVRKKVKKKA